MKYKGQAIKGKNREIIPIPREGGDIIFIAEAVQDWKDFDSLVSEPEPPEIIKPGGVRIKDKKDKGYLQAVDKYNELRTHFLVIKSLEATEDLEWETIDVTNPDTWSKYQEELKASDFSDIEIGRIVIGVMRANSLDENMIEEARTNFLHGQSGQNE